MEISRLTFFPRHTRFTVRFHNHLYSSQIARLAEHLLDVLPNLANHRCLNRNGLPFTEELNDSELGHVFEHVVLELLSNREVYARGQTTWNWERDPIGTYQVTINSGKRLLIKECLLIAQVIFTNLLVGPPLRLRPHGRAGGAQVALPITLVPAQESDGLLFSFLPETSGGGRFPKSPAEAGQLGGEVKLRRQ